ncbi:hypothetical protein M885DRAFT_522154 [Pelagophyceae sp. CCMP2097]|nr:hypothetical protein M885DRAFT_522154 [Pelagophyceae sp. CCMP2097]
MPSTRLRLQRRRARRAGGPTVQKHRRATSAKASRAESDGGSASSSYASEDAASESEDDGAGHASADSVTITLEAGQRLVLIGSAALTCLSGVLEVHGARLTPETAELEVHSPKWLPALVVCAPQAHRGEAGVLHLRRLDAPSVVSAAGDARDVGAVAGDFFRVETCCALRFDNQPATDAAAALRAAAYDEPHRWRSAAQGWRGASAVICGRQGAGKSTFARLLVNTRLAKHATIAVLECDLGQPMLGAPGCISLKLVRKPLLKAPHAHCALPEAETVVQFFLGDVSPKDAPGAYTNAIGKCCDAWRAYHSDMPLVVNTCGWIAGLGAELLSAILSLVEPQNTFVVGEPGFPEGSTLGNAFLNHRASYVGTFARPDDGKAAAPAVARRALSLAAYFAPDAKGALARNGTLSDGDSATARALLRQTALAAPYAHLAMGLVGGAAQCCLATPEDALRALIGSVVALASQTDAQHLAVSVSASANGPAVLAGECSDVPIAGLALVRGLDLVRRELLLLTPLPRETVEQCDLLLRGAMMPPTQLLYSPMDTTSFPFLTCESLSSDLATSMKSRNNITRKVHAQSAKR